MPPLARNRHGLAIDATTKPNKKYMGEPNDLHFVPDSPLIERRVFTAQEEGELTRICAMVLAQVPHTDDMASGDNPLSLVAAQIKVRAALAEQRGQTHRPYIKLPPSAFSSQATRDQAIESATPSDSSKRDTLNRSDFSTPMTSAGITPGETGKRFSDAVRQVHGSKRSTRSIRKERPGTVKSIALSDVENASPKSTEVSNRKPFEPRKAGRDVDTTTCTVRLVSDSSSKSILDAHLQLEKLSRPPPNLRLELDKDLPMPPQSQAPIVDDIKIQPLNRMFKSIRRKKSQMLGEKEQEQISQIELPPPMPSARSLNHSNGRPCTAPESRPFRLENPQQHIAPLVLPFEPEPRRKFYHRFFVRKTRTAELPVTKMVSC